MKWTDEKIAFLRTAYDRSGANKALADWIAQGLSKGSRVLENGCGLGYLSLELAQRGMEVTALDIDGAVLDVLRGNICKRATRNVCVLCEDAHAYRPQERYDAVIFCFFGGIDDALRMAKEQCFGEVFYISRNYDHHRFSAGKHPVHYSGYRDAREKLDHLHVPYTWKEMSLDIGQPFKNMEQVRRFFSLYSRDEQRLSDAYLESRLIRTADSAYPLFMPHERSIGMIRFSACDIPDEYIANSGRSCQ